MIMTTKNFTPEVRRAARAGVLAAGLLFFSGISAYADDYSPYGISNNLNPVDAPGGFNLQFIGSETGSWETNPLMLINNSQKSLYGSVTTPELLFTDKTPTSQLNADMLLNENIFNQSSFDSTDAHGKFGANTQLQRWGAGANVAVDYDTTRTSELFPVGLGGALQSTAVRHLGLSIAPNISYNPTAVDKVAILGTLADSQYEKTFGNYATASLTPTYTHNFDPLNAGVFSITAQRYQSTSGPPVYVDTVGPSVGWLGTLSERLTAKATVGLQTTRQYGSGAVQVPWSLQYVFSGGLTYKGQQDKVDFETSRNDYPFGNGTDSLFTSFSITEQHNINASFAVNVGASYQTADYQSTANGSLDYLLTGTGGLTYHATERLDIAATYQYRRETLINTAGDAHDHLVTLGLVYRPQLWNL